MDSNFPGDHLERNNENGHEFLVVGIGASAGGINALKEFFENVPDRSGMAYVVILHLSLLTMIANSHRYYR